MILISKAVSAKESVNIMLKDEGRVTIDPFESQLTHIDYDIDDKRPKDGLRSEERSEEHTSELQSLMRISYAVFCLKKKKNTHTIENNESHNTLTEYTRIQY